MKYETWWSDARKEYYDNTFLNDVTFILDTDLEDCPVCMYKVNKYNPTYKNPKPFKECLDNEVVYIPALGFEETEDGEMKIIDYYTKKEFINLCDNDVLKAATLFEMLDGQYPETLIAENEDWWY